MNLERKYNKIVNKYCKTFANNNEIDFEGWIGGRIGEIAEFGDYFFDFHEIKFCVENDISIDILINWYYFFLEFHKKANYNFESYYKLRLDFEHKKGFGFDNLEFEKYLLYIRI